LSKFVQQKSSALIEYLTLTTDYGEKDPYLAMLRGSLMAALPSVRQIDITHNISKFNIREAAYVLKNCYAFYPEGSLHLVDVSGYNQNSRHWLLFGFAKHFFLVPDNGICSLITDNGWLEPRRIAIADQAQGSFDLIDHVLPQLTALAELTPEALGPAVSDYQLFTTVFPSMQGNRMMGQVLYTDSYGNVVTNIDKGYFDRNIREPYAVHLKRSHKGGNTIGRIQQHFNATELGETVAFFGHNGLLHIAIRGGSAAQLLGLRTDDPVMIEQL